MGMFKEKREIELNEKKYIVSNFTFKNIVDIGNIYKSRVGSLKKKLLDEKKEQIIKDYKLAGKDIDVSKLLECKVEDYEVVDTSFHIDMVKLQLKMLLNKYQTVTDEEMDLIFANESQTVIEDLINDFIEKEEDFLIQTMRQLLKNYKKEEIEKAIIEAITGVEPKN
jgi:hypothetical protein